MSAAMYNTTLIIGNGFDLEMKMETSYSHFYNYLKSIGFFEKNKNLPLIEYIRDKGEKDNWYDFEGMIKDFAIKSESSVILRRSSFLNALLYELQKGETKVLSEIKTFTDLITIAPKLKTLIENVSANKFGLFDSFVKIGELCDSIRVELTHYSEKCTRDASDAIRLLKEELKSYLTKVRPKYEYSKSLSLLFSWLGIDAKGMNSVRDGLLSHYSKEEQAYVFPNINQLISFNYTDACKTLSDIIELYTGTPLLFESKVLGKICYHIHGTLHDNIVFGANDDADIVSEYACLKKKYYLVENAKRKFHTIISSSKRVVIYGHSIQGIDFEYYQEELNNDKCQVEFIVICRDEEECDHMHLELEKKNIKVFIKFISKESEEEFIDLCRAIREDIF